ncbi:MAG TPA: oxidoreductase [Acidisarcina sp.]|nr:oxidoreductase [Acidisarcina sp.]
MSRWTTANIPRLDGKLAIVTGANSGIGLHTARALARAGCAVILACRNADKAAATKLLIERETPDARLQPAMLNLADLASVRNFTASFLASGLRLDLLINNAGVMALPTRQTTADGFELQFGTNHLGHFALTGPLLPCLLAAPAARVVTVSSLAHRGGRIDFDNLQWVHDYKPWPAYRQSKLANLLFGFELERRFEQAGVTVRSMVVHPGVANTSLFANGPGKGKGMVNALIPKVIGWFAQSEEQGALPTLYAATAPEAQGGHFYGPDGFRQIKGYPVEVEPEAQAKDAALAARLWDVSEQLTGRQYNFSAR